MALETHYKLFRSLGSALVSILLADQIGPETWKLAGQYSATYTGGANFAAVGGALETSGELFAAGIAADVIMTAIWMATRLAVPVRFSRGRSSEPLIPAGVEEDGSGDRKACCHKELPYRSPWKCRRYARGVGKPKATVSGNARAVA